MDIEVSESRIMSSVRGMQASRCIWMMGSRTRTNSGRREGGVPDPNVCVRGSFCKIKSITTSRTIEDTNESMFEQTGQAEWKVEVAVPSKAEHEGIQEVPRGDEVVIMPSSCVLHSQGRSPRCYEARVKVVTKVHPCVCHHEPVLDALCSTHEPYLSLPLRRRLTLGILPSLATPWSGTAYFR